MDDTERKTHYAILHVELEDVTAKEAREFWGALREREIEVGGYAAAIVGIDPQAEPEGGAS